MFDKAIKEAYLIDLAIPNIQSLQHHHREASEIYRHERKVNNHMANECVLYSTISIVYNGNCPK
jgi:hypothetical protein